MPPHTASFEAIRAGKTTDVYFQRNAPHPRGGL